LKTFRQRHCCQPKRIENPIDWIENPQGGRGPIYSVKSQYQKAIRRTCVLHPQTVYVADVS
jgi:hypothetical protein